MILQFKQHINNIHTNTSMRFHNILQIHILAYIRAILHIDVIFLKDPLHYRTVNRNCAHSRLQSR